MWLVLSACIASLPVRSPPETGDETSTVSTSPTPPIGDPCPDGPGSACAPFPADPLPYVDVQDTTDSPFSRVDRYGCDPDIDESGPGWWYTLTSSQP